MKLGEMLPMMRDFFSDLMHYRRDVSKYDRWIKKYARQKGYRVNPHWMIYTNLKIWMAESEKAFGKRYCPCYEPSADEALNKKLLCPCAFAEQEIRERGACHCVLFGRGDLDNGQFKEAEARLMEEYRGQPLNLKDGVLDTRGMPRDALRDLPVPDTLHQVKRALGRFKGTPFQVIVATEREVTNMKGFAALRGIAFRSERDGDAFRMTLN